MQQACFEAALRLILAGPGDQPLMRILRIAMDLADCPMGLIGVRWPDRFQPIVAAGIPLSEYRLELARSDSIANRLLSTTVIEDATTDPDFAAHPFVTGRAHWRYIASAPVPLPTLPVEVVLNCADSHTGKPRRADLLDRLEECAAICADELRLIGDIAAQSEMLVEVGESAELREKGIRESGTPMALVGREGQVVTLNRRLRALLGIADNPDGSMTLADLFPMDGTLVTARVDQVLTDGAPATAILAHSRDRRRSYLLDIIRVVSADSEQPLALCTVTDRTRTFARSEELQRDDAESPHVIADFLLDTLITQRRLLRRGPVPYHALRKWRASVKDVQVAALKALKRNPSAHFIDAVAGDLASAAAALFGEQTIRAVTAVPCGNSGPDCLAARLGRATAERLGLRFVAAFNDLPPSGGSHPRGNTRRPAMTLAEPVTEPVLLIDDVATSGAHLAEAAILLKENGTPAILPLVWIANG